jgi:hypothetical protein
MHGYAYWAVICICIVGMYMRHLGYGQQRKQQQAENRQDCESSWLSAIVEAEDFLHIVQILEPSY